MYQSEFDSGDGDTVQRRSIQTLQRHNCGEKCRIILYSSGVVFFELPLNAYSLSPESLASLAKILSCAIVVQQPNVQVGQSQLHRSVTLMMLDDLSPQTLT